MASAAVVSFVIGGSGVVAIGLFITPMMTELSWSNSLTSTAATIFSFAAFVAAPGAGVAVDRFGVPMVMTFGVLTFFSGFLLASQCHTPYLMFTAFALVGLGYSTSFYVPGAVIVTNWMGSRKSLGMGIIWGSCSIGAALFSLLIGWCIETYDWRVSCRMVAVMAAMMLPVILLTIRTQPNSIRASERSSEIQGGRMLLLSRHFVVATASSALYAIGANCIYFHVVSILIKAGYPSHLAGLVFGMSWVASAVGSLVIGKLAELFGAKAILAACQCSSAVGILFLLGAGQAAAGVACVLAFLIVWGLAANCVIQLVPVIFAERFGSRHFGMLIGVQSSVLGIAGSSAPILAGLIYDRFHDYRFAIYLSVVLTMLSFLLALLIGASRREGSLGLPVGHAGTFTGIEEEM